MNALPIVPRVVWASFAIHLHHLHHINQVYSRRRQLTICQVTIYIFRKCRNLFFVLITSHQNKQTKKPSHNILNKL